jgi:lipoate-protein ligase B
MDLAPFRLIRPCGLRDTEAVQLADLVRPAPAFDEVRAQLLQRLRGALDAAPPPPGGA